jgi:hypothetical protein
VISALAQSAVPNRRRCWTGAFLAAAFALLVSVAGAAPASAISAIGPQIAVGTTVSAVAPTPAAPPASHYDLPAYAYGDQES